MKKFGIDIIICANLVIFWSLLMFNKVLFIYPKIF